MLGGVLVGGSVFYSNVLIGLTVKIWLGSTSVIGVDAETTI